MEEGGQWTNLKLIHEELGTLSGYSNCSKDNGELLSLHILPKSTLTSYLHRNLNVTQFNPPSTK